MFRVVVIHLEISLNEKLLNLIFAPTLSEKKQRRLAKLFLEGTPDLHAYLDNYMASCRIDRNFRLL